MTDVDDNHLQHEVTIIMRIQGACEVFTLYFFSFSLGESAIRFAAHLIVSWLLRGVRQAENTRRPIGMCKAAAGAG